jgi:hypothetical protein
VIENSKIPFFGSHLSVKSPCITAKSTIPMWLLYTDTITGHDISTCSFSFLSNHLICDLGSSSINVEMTAILLLSLNITAETLTESKFVAYSCEKPCGFFFKSC